VCTYPCLGFVSRNINTGSGHQDNGTSRRFIDYKTKLYRRQTYQIEYILSTKSYIQHDHIGGVMVSMFISSVIYREPRSCQTKDCKIGICCISTKHALLRRKSKDWLARNQDNVFEWGDMSISGLLFQ
jgi:hypothetical protein